MTHSASPVVFLSGAGGGAPDLDMLRAGVEDLTRFEVIGYPGWKRYLKKGFSAEDLIVDLAAQIAVKAPQGPLCIVGLSIGGHFGYAAALRLKAMGREIAGFCAIDAFMIGSAKPSAGWQGRAMAQGFELLRRRRFHELGRFLRSRFWRSLVRFAGNWLPALLQRFSSSSRVPALLMFAPIFEEELSMRLLIRQAAPWIASLDREPIVLEAPAILLRTKPAASDDAAWRRRCPNIEIFEIAGQHHTLFEADNIGSLREAFLTATRDWRKDSGH